METPGSPGASAGSLVQGSRVQKTPGLLPTHWWVDWHWPHVLGHWPQDMGPVPIYCLAELGPELWLHGSRDPELVSDQ